MRFSLLILVTLLAGLGEIHAQQAPFVVSARCAGCHPVPRPGSMPRYVWPKIVDSMAGIMERSSMPFAEFEKQEVIEYYMKHAPEKLAVIPDDYEECGISFDQFPAGLPSLEERPQVTSVKFTDLDGDGNNDDIIVTDNSNSAVSWLHLAEDGETWEEQIIATAPAPVNSTPVDIDGDGDIDLAISAMGFMHPNDELIGEFHLLINQGDGTFEKKVLVKDSPRITDCAPADFDGDGDIDFILAMFGWRYTGAIGYLEQLDGGEFRLKIIMEINGCMQVVVNDINGDGLPDFVALVTQQHESIIQFTNTGNAEFSNSYITRANHPAFGSSSIHLEDLDQDGDEDILFTNGDMMDQNPEPKPYHGVRWLENNGKGAYNIHYLAGMPGCYCAKPADMDGDGDLDVVISALYFQWQEADFPTLAWLENTGGFKTFVRRMIAYSPTNLAKVAVGDANNDGRPDIVGGGMHVPGPLDRAGRLTIWLGKKPQEPVEVPSQ